MKNFIRMLFVALLVLVSTQTFAQRFGVQAGVNFSNVLSKDDDFNYSEELDFSSLIGFNAGVNFEMGFGELLAVEAAAIANSKGFQFKEDDISFKTTLLYIDIPVLLKVGPSLGPVKVFGAAGPYVGFGLTGKFKGELDGETEEEDVSWGNDAEENDAKRLDFGAKFGVGAEVSGFTFGAYYNLGLANTSPYTEDGYKDSHRFISISVGYKFGGK